MVVAKGSLEVRRRGRFARLLRVMRSLLLPQPRQEPIRFSADAWKAWDERI